MKICTKCHVEQVLQARQSWCKKCAAEHNRKRWAVDPSMRERQAKSQRIRQLKKFGIDMEKYQAMFLSQNGKCALCGKESSRTLHVDHCHKTGKVRGLLCGPCNLALGIVEEIGGKAFDDYLNKQS